MATTLNASWSGFSDALSGVNSYFLSLTNNEGTANGTATSNTSGSVSAALNQTNTLYVWAIDIAGNIGLSTSRSIFVINPLGDLDNDGALNEDEEIAGTDASSENSVFEEFISMPGGPSSVRLTWPYSTNRAYIIYWTTNLADSAATQTVTNPAYSASNGIATWMETNLPTQMNRHYWVGVSFP